MSNNSNDLFEKLGIEMKDGKVNIDINQTKDFFNALKQTFENTAQNIQNDITEGDVNMEETGGIKIDKEHINIDFTKTQSFIEELGTKIQNFLAEIDKAVENIDKK